MSKPRIFGLTSPLTKDDGIGALQRAMKKKGWYDGPIDSIAGPHTVQAFYRSKYWLGYRKPDQTGGDLLYSYLTGKKEPDLAMKARIKYRKSKVPKLTIGQKMLEEAKKHIGTKEFPPGTNRVFFSEWYQVIGAWCDMFVSYCGVVAGSIAFRKGERYSYVPTTLADARAGRNNLSLVSGLDAAKPGDLVIFDWNRDNTPDHIGLFDHKTGSRTFKTVEGNTGIGNDSNGGEVMARDRSLDDATIHFVRVHK